MVQKLADPLHESTLVMLFIMVVVDMGFLVMLFIMVVVGMGARMKLRPLHHTFLRESGCHMVKPRPSGRDLTDNTTVVELA